MREFGFGRGFASVDRTRAVKSCRVELNSIKIQNSDMVLYPNTAYSILQE